MLPKLLHRLTGWDSTNSASQQNSASSEDPGLPNVYSAPFFYGRITRQEAEDILKVNGMVDGSYLLRESITPMGNFSFTIVYKGNPVHYSIEKRVNGQYSISDGDPFPDPLSLIQHYHSIQNGFITVPKVPCERRQNQEAIAFRGLSVKELHAHMKEEAKKMNANLSRALGPMRESLLMHVLLTLHKKMPWFHGNISREEGIERLEKNGHKDGKFIVRERTDANSFALTISHEGANRHYLISQQDGESYRIDAGPRFKALIVLIDHYHNKKDGLPCRLVCPCPNPNTDLKTWESYQSLTKNLTTKPGKPPPPLPPTPPERERSASTSSQGGACASPVFPPPPPRPAPSPGIAAAKPPTPAQRKSKSTSSGKYFWDQGNNSYGAEMEEEEREPNGLAVEPPSREEAEELENTYITIRGDVLKTELKPEQVTVEGKLGSGQFGEVRKGKCQVGRKVVPVAIKTLKNNDNADGEQEILSEAKLMKRLDHQHIVRMIGVCKGETLMLVLELAELGPLKKYLERHLSMKIWHQLELMAQVCDGMAYLAEKDVVHRDLATRNVLLVTDHFAKISDFGLSRMMETGAEYYTAHGPGRWPLMWYAPECLYYHKFESSSDVWSFGVTMWEIMSFGARPYDKKKPPQILQYLENGSRLTCPRNCPEEIYQIMLDCWEWYKEDRPTFKKLQPRLHKLCVKYQELRS